MSKEQKIQLDAEPIAEPTQHTKPEATAKAWPALFTFHEYAIIKKIATHTKAFLAHALKEDLYALHTLEEWAEKAQKQLSKKI